MSGLGRFVAGGVSAGLVLTAVIPTAACEKTAVKTSVSPCFRVLPQAHSAVGSQGTFVDVARRKGAQIYPSSGGPPISAPLQPTVTGPAPAPTQVRPSLGADDPRRDDCIVAYRGVFDPARIPLLRGSNRTGRYAIVIVGVRSAEVRAVVLTERLPTVLHHH